MTALTACILGLEGLAAALLLGGAWSDLKRRIIPNEVCLWLALIGLDLRLADATLPASVGLALAILLAMIVFWRLGMVGGGDVKLLAASALLVPPAQVAGFLMAVSASGGLLALVYLVLGAFARRRRRGRPRTAAARLPGRLLRIEAWRARRNAGLPYGCAIALGTLLAVFGR